MDDNDFFDFLEARNAALEAAVGYFIVNNVRKETLEAIAVSAADAIICLAARVVLYRRR